jgi:hypothetical protein
MNWEELCKRLEEYGEKTLSGYLLRYGEAMFTAELNDRSHINCYKDGLIDFIYSNKGIEQTLTIADHCTLEQIEMIVKGLVEGNR